MASDLRPGNSSEVELQAVKEELDLARKKIDRYTHLVTTLYDELDTLRNNICNNCKTKLVPGAAFSSSAGRSSSTPAQAPLRQRQHNSGSPQTQLIRNVETSGAFSSTRRVSFEPSSGLPPSTQPRPVGVADSAVVIKSDEADWSVVHNHEVGRTLNVRLAHTIKMKSKVFCVKFSREGKHLAVGLQTGETYIYDFKKLSNRVLVDHTAKERPSIWAVQFSPDDKYVAIGGSDSRIKIWDIVERRVLATFEGHILSVHSLDFSPDGRSLVSGSFDIRIWHMRDGSSKKLLDTNMSHIYSVAFSPDGRHVAAASYDGMLRIWDSRTGQLLERWKAKGHAQPLLSVVFTKDGRGLLSGGDDKTIKFWDVSSLTADPSVSRKGAVGGGKLDEEKEYLTFQRHTETVYCVSTFPDNRWILSGSRDCSICIWDAQSGIWQCTLNGHQHAVMAIDTSSDGCHLASASQDCLIRIWRYEQTG